MLSQFCFISHYYSNEYGETPVDSAYRSGEQKMIELMDKDGLLPRDDDPKLPSRICDVRYSNEQQTSCQLHFWIINLVPY